MLPKNFYDNVEKPGALKHILYGDSVSKEMKTIVKFKDSHIEYITFDEIWSRLSKIIPTSTEHNKEYLFINDEVETISYDIGSDCWNLNIPQYLMRHKINKQIIRLNFTNIAYLDVTEDHSMLDYINNNLIIKKPLDMEYIPTISSNINIQFNEINCDYFLLGLWFNSENLFKTHTNNQFQHSTTIEIENLLENHLNDIKTYQKDKWLKDTPFSSNKNIIRIISNKLYKQLRNDSNKLISFIIGYWIANGSFSSQTATIVSESEELLEQIQTLLMIIGLYSQLELDKNYKNSEEKINRDIFKLHINLNNHLTNLFEKIKHSKNLLKKLEFYPDYYEKKLDDINSQIHRKTSYTKLSQLKPIKIISNEYIDYNDHVYDWCVPQFQNFIANGCLVHNTDSLFITIPVQNSEKLTTEQKLKISNKVSEDINNAVTKYLNEYLLPRSNISPDQNTTYFKSEMLIDSIMFLDVKKTYAYKLLAKKGKIYDNPSIEYTGIQVVRSNVAKLTQDLLREIIENIILNENMPVKEKLFQTTNVVNSYHQKFLDYVDNLELNDISIPGKWSKADQFINGMTLYNFIMKKEIFSLGSSGYFIYCNFKNLKLFQNLKADITKIKGIVIPRNYDKLLLDKKFNDYQIQIDKQQQWETLYSTTIDRIVNLIKTLK